MAFDPVLFEKAWSDHWGSHHEGAHAVVARYFGLKVNHADMRRVSIDHQFYSSPDCRNSRERLIVSAAGDVATSLFFKYGGTGQQDHERSIERLRDLGASPELVNRLMSDAKREAEVLVIALRLEIAAVATALRTHGALNQDQIDTAMQAARSPR